MQSALYIVAIILVFGAIIVVHEAGHFFVAKLAKMRVHEFAIGMGPVLASVQRGETQYSIRAVPVGGMVRIAGVEPGDEDDPEGFSTKPVWARIAAIAAGPLMNIVLAFAIFFAIYTLIGVPSGSVTPVVEHVLQGKPAAKAGIKSGDTLLSVKGFTIAPTQSQIDAAKEKLVASPEWRKASDHERSVTLKDFPDTVLNDRLADAQKIIRGNPGKPLPITIRRNEATLNLVITPARDVQLFKPIEKNGELVGVKKERVVTGLIGVTFHTSKTERLNPWQGFKKGVGDTWKNVKMLLTSLKITFSGQVPVRDSVGGPVKIVSMMYQGAQASWLTLLSFAGMISVMIAFMNLIPFPALDGARIAFLIFGSIFKEITGRKFDTRKEELVHSVGLIVLLLLIVVITANDIWGLMHPPQ
jgi:regulator of sigma E protease